MSVSFKRLRGFRAGVVVALVGLFAVTACTAETAEPKSGPESTTPAAAGAFPVSIKHAFGSTEIKAEPQRVVTWGFGSADTALALGVVPVAIPMQAYGGDKAGVLPWIGAELTELKAETPKMLTNNGTDVPFEEIAAVKPDLILANYSGITEADYAILSKLAPTVAYPDQPWATPWRDVAETVGIALGKKAEALKLIADTEAKIAETAAAHPELKGKSVAAIWDDGKTFYVYKSADPRVEFLTDLGLVSAPSVETLANGESSFFFTLSVEQVDKLTSDILLSYSDTEENAQKFLNQPYAKTMPQVKNDNVASVSGTALIAAVSPPTVLSLTWGLDDYVTALSAAAK